MIPPSPSLSARMMMVTYLSVTTTISDQNASDSTPSTVSWALVRQQCGENTTLSVYSRLVPMSPNTTPMAPMISASCDPAGPWPGGWAGVEAGAGAADMAAGPWRMGRGGRVLPVSEGPTATPCG